MRNTKQNIKSYGKQGEELLSEVVRVLAWIN